MSLTVEKVTASLSKGGSQYSPSSITFSAATNSWPTIKVELVVGSSKSANKAIQVDADLITQLKDFKNENEIYNLTFGTEKDKTELSCFVHAAEMSVSVDDVSIKLDMYPEYTKVDRLDLSVFKSDKRLGGDEDIDGVSDLPKVSESSNIMEYIKKCFQYAKERWDKQQENYYKDPSVSKITKDTVRQITKNNEELYPIFEELLSNSAESVGNIYSISELFLEGDPTLYSVIINTITQDNNSFLSTIMSLGNLFNLIYVPGINSIGRYIKKESIVDDPKSSVIAPVIGTWVHSGSLGIGRIGYVGVTGNINDDIDAVQSYERNTKVIFPEQVNLEKSSACINTAPPPWLPKYAYIVSGSVDGDPSDGSAEENQKPEQKYTEHKNITSKVLQEWCRQEFYYQRYAPSSATTQIFFGDVSDFFGNVVNIGSGQTLFRGFVHSIRQIIHCKVDINTTIGMIGVLFEGEQPEGK